MIRPSQIYERIINKNSKGLQELEVVLNKLASDIVDQQHTEDLNEAAWEQYDAVVNYFLSKARNYIHYELHRTLLVQSLELIGFSLDQSRQVNKFFKPITSTILSFFTDSSEKVKLAAIGAIYNIMTKYLEQGREFFIETFERLSVLIADESGQIRQAATFLNQALKTMIYDAELDQDRFDLKNFVELLAQRLQSGSSIARQFMIDWLMAIEEVPQFEISFDLPLFFRQVFLLLEDPSKSLKSKGEECLKKFLHVFRERLAIQGKLSSKLSYDSAQVIFEMILLLIRENISAEINLHALEWLQVFTKFFTLQLSKKSQIFLEKIYSFMLKEVLLVVITTLSDESDRIRKISSRINEALLNAFPQMNISKKSISKSSQLLEGLLSESRTPVRVEAVIRWIKLFLQSNSQHFLCQINRLIQLIVEKICDKNATRTLFQLIEGSLFVEAYYDQFVTTLIVYLFKNDKISPEPIFKQIMCLKDAESHFLKLCRTVQTHQSSQFQYRMIQNLIGVLVTEPPLETLRLNLMEKEDPELFVEFFLIFSTNEAASLILCFLSRKYYLAKEFIHLLAQEQRLSDKNFRSLIRMSNLIEHSNMNHLRSDLRKNSIAVKAYLCLLMALPYGKCSGLLLQRIPPQMPKMIEEDPSKSQQQLTSHLLSQYNHCQRSLQIIEGF